jgi:phosphoenolpyruvate carboxykinase (ATP)
MNSRYICCTISWIDVLCIQCIDRMLFCYLGYHETKGVRALIEALLTDRLEAVLRAADTKRNHSVAQLVEAAIGRREARLTATGALCATTGKFTGRSPKDKYIVQDDTSATWVDWGKVNQPIDESVFESLYGRALDCIAQQGAYVFDGYAGADPAHRLAIRVVTEYAWHNLFARQLFIRPTPAELATHTPQFTVIDGPSLLADPAADGTNSETAIVISFRHRVVLICGTQYAGEIKKSIFTVLNFLLPEQNTLPMHCSANASVQDGRVTLFFGLSGTGKTTLSADPARTLIGDDEHGWSDDGVFNFEGGCYAKCINLSPELEPQIWNSIRFGTVLENVDFDPETRAERFDSARLTENTRAAYPLEFIDNIEPSGRGGHPSAIIFLTADASGVLPPIARLTREQAMYHFLSGYTSKLAGTERGVTSPEATFSTCFGAPFLPRPASEYARMLGERLDQHRVPVYLVNTGWTGGPYGVGQRMQLAFTRAMVKAAIGGQLDQASVSIDPVFGLAIPQSVPGVPASVLSPRSTWARAADYDEAAAALAKKFHDNFERFTRIDASIRAGAPLFGR